MHARLYVKSNDQWDCMWNTGENRVRVHVMNRVIWSVNYVPQYYFSMIVVEKLRFGDDARICDFQMNPQEGSLVLVLIHLSLAKLLKFCFYMEREITDKCLTRDMRTPAASLLLRASLYPPKPLTLAPITMVANRSVINDTSCISPLCIGVKIKRK